jgi:hypothetical protein
VVKDLQGGGCDLKVLLQYSLVEQTKNQDNRCFPSIYLEDLRETTINLGQISRSWGRDLNQRFLECEIGALTTFFSLWLYIFGSMHIYILKFQVY